MFAAIAFAGGLCITVAISAIFWCSTVRSGKRMPIQVDPTKRMMPLDQEMAVSGYYSEHQWWESLAAERASWLPAAKYTNVTPN
jgi:hypothetical protein